jgi:hypothetical protein
VFSQTIIPIVALSPKLGAEVIAKLSNLKVGLASDS